MMRVRLTRRPSSTSTTEMDQREAMVTTGYHRNTCVLPRNGSAARERKENSQRRNVKHRKICHVPHRARELNPNIKSMHADKAMNAPL